EAAAVGVQLATQRQRGGAARVSGEHCAAARLRLVREPLDTHCRSEPKAGREMIGLQSERAAEACGSLRQAAAIEQGVDEVAGPVGARGLELHGLAIARAGFTLPAELPQHVTEIIQRLYVTWIVQQRRPIARRGLGALPAAREQQAEVVVCHGEP